MFLFILFLDAHRISILPEFKSLTPRPHFFVAITRSNRRRNAAKRFRFSWNEFRRWVFCYIFATLNPRSNFESCLFLSDINTNMLRTGINNSSKSTIRIECHNNQEGKNAKRTRKQFNFNPVFQIYCVWYYMSRMCSLVPLFSSFFFSLSVPPLFGR